MRSLATLGIIAAFAIAACGQAAAPSDADAQTSGGAAAAGSEVTAAEKATILSALQLRANAQGMVENECGDMVTPEFRTLDLGSGVGRAVAFIIGGGPSTAACYGDGPLIIVYRNADGSWRNIYMQRGGMPAILTTQHHGGNDIAAGGPGFSFPVWEWNGAEYAHANREVPDSALSDARFIQ
jgi:hypothetical protein